MPGDGSNISPLEDQQITAAGEQKPNVKPDKLSDESIRELHEAAIENNWEKLLEKCKNNTEVLKAKLTNASDTVLHIVVACYDHRKKMHLDAIKQKMHLNAIKQIVEAIPADELEKVLGAENDKGNTPLHLAAKYGNVEICVCISDRDGKLIKKRNKNGETPLFLAAHHDHMKAFWCLLNAYQKSPDEKEAETTSDNSDDEKKAKRESILYSLCRRSSDGRTILHSAVSGECYESAFRIIKEFANFVHYKTVKGETPLLILANKPNSFKSTSSLRFTEHIVYWCVDVLEVEVAHREETTERKYPENYVTLVSLAALLWKLIQKGIGWPRKRNFSCSQRDEENTDDNIKEEYKWFPSNYTTLINILKLLLMAAVVILGRGVRGIKKLQETRERHKWAKEIMNKMVESGTRFLYHSDGQTNPAGYLRPFGFEVPQDPPTDEKGGQDTPSKEQQEQLKAASKLLEGALDKFQLEISSEDKNRKDVLVLKTSSCEAMEMAGSTRETPLLTAAKMGIFEIVEKILRIFPMAIYELDAEEKNALLLAIENRHVQLFDYLIEVAELPETVFTQVDKHGNSACHLAGTKGPPNPWAAPDTPLQIYGEAFWLQYVHHSLPKFRYTQFNNEGRTPYEVFIKEHQDFRSGAEWLTKTSESCSVVAALIVTVAFATSATVPGGNDDKTGHPLLQNRPTFNLFTISSLLALSFSLTSLVLFLTIITSGCQVSDLATNLPRKLLTGLSHLFASILAMLVSFCAGHFFTLSKNLEHDAALIYTVTLVPLTIFAFSNVNIYYELLRLMLSRVPRRRYNAF